MRIVLVDDEPLALEDTTAMFKSISADISVRGFTGADEALEYINSNPVDIAVLDIDMPGENGITVAEKIRQLKPDAAILFLTAYKEFAYDAFSVHPSGYLLKPVMPEQLKKEIDYAMSSRRSASAHHIEAHTFGNFELLIDKKPIVFKRSKAKELIAYLIDRQGTSVSRAEIAGVLFENDPYDHSKQKYLDAIIRSMRDTLREYDISDILQMERTGLRVVADKIDCDMYRFYKGDTQAIKAFRGEYMSSYPWGVLVEANMNTIWESYKLK